MIAIVAILDRAPLLAAAVAVVVVCVAAVARNITRPIVLAAILAAVSLAALIRLPLSKQTASFPKVLKPTDRVLYEDGR